MLRQALKCAPSLSGHLVVAGAVYRAAAAVGTIIVCTVNGRGAVVVNVFDDRRFGRRFGAGQRAGGATGERDGACEHKCGTDGENRGCRARGFHKKNRWVTFGEGEDPGVAKHAPRCATRAWGGRNETPAGDIYQFRGQTALRTTRSKTD